METNYSGKVNLGVILCKHCNAVIDTLDTEKVMIYYLNCGQCDCENHETIQGETSRDNE